MSLRPFTLTLNTGPVETETIRARSDQAAIDVAHEILMGEIQIEPIQLAYCDVREGKRLIGRWHFNATIKGPLRMVWLVAKVESIE